MKNLALTMVFGAIISSFTFAQMPVSSSGNKTGTPGAQTMLKEACAKAEKEKKDVFVIFHASWCTWCHKMDASMNDASCRDFFNKNFITVHFVVDENPDKKSLETPGADELRTQYHGEGQGIPFWLVFDSNGNLISDSKMPNTSGANDIGENTGCPASAAEVDFFISVLKKCTTVSAGDEVKIRERFRKNEVK